MVKGDDPPPDARAKDPEPDPPAGEKARVICPECGGVLTERPEAGVLQWQCRVGHRYSPDTLVDLQADDVEGALWAAIRTLADRAVLLERMARQSEERGQPRSARRFRRQAEAASEQAEIVRQALSIAAGSTLRRILDNDEQDRLRDQEGAA